MTEAIHILIVDDDPYIVELLTARLQSQGYRVSAAANGLRAFDALSRDMFDLILCDVVMPEMDGLVFCTELRKKGNTLPLLFLTAKGQPQDIVQLLSVGADDYLVKPFESGELLARIKVLLRRRTK